MMTHDEMIAVIQAHRDGKTIQFRDRDSQGKWDDLHPVCFSANFGTYDYRVKPEPPKPREFWLIRSCDDVPFTAYSCRQRGITDNQIHVREVID